MLGAKVRWWIDPVAALLLSALIIGLWLRTAYAEFQLLIGVSADTSMLQHITYICKPWSPPLPLPSHRSSTQDEHPN